MYIKLFLIGRILPIATAHTEQLENNFSHQLIGNIFKTRPSHTGLESNGTTAELHSSTYENSFFKALQNT